MRSVALLGAFIFVTSNYSLAQQWSIARVSEALVCSSQNLADCKKINVTNLAIQNLFSNESVKVTFDVDGKTVTLPMPPGKESAKCKIAGLKGESNQEVKRQDGYFYSKNEIEWGQRFDAVHEKIELVVHQFLFNSDLKFDVDYVHDTWCPTISETYEAVVYRIRGTIN